MTRTPCLALRALTLVLASAGLAAAQPDDWHEVRTGPASDAERAYAEGLGGAAAQVEVRRVELDWVRADWQVKGAMARRPYAEESQGPTRVRGVQARAGDLEVFRLRFPDAAQAQAFAGTSAAAFDPAGTTRVVEARGAQVVVLSGARLEDPAAAARARAAAWRGLPVQGESSLLAVTRGKDAFAARTDPRGPLYETAKHEHERALDRKERLAQPGSEVRGEWRADGSARVWSGAFTTTLKVGPDGATKAFAAGPGHAERQAALETYLRDLQGEGAGPALEGASNALGRALGGF